MLRHGHSLKYLNGVDFKKIIDVLNSIHSLKLRMGLTHKKEFKIVSPLPKLKKK